MEIDTSDPCNIIREYTFKTFSIKYVYIPKTNSVERDVTVWLITVPELGIIDNYLLSSDLGDYSTGAYIEPELSKDQVKLIGLKAINRTIKSGKYDYAEEID